MIYLDSNIFLYALLDNGSFGEHARRLLSKIQEGVVPASTSVITWDEVLWVARKRLDRQDSLLAAGDILETAGLRILDLNKNVLWKAQELVGKYDLGPRDAIHAATALWENAKALVSEDNDFKKVREVHRVSLARILRQI